MDGEIPLDAAHILRVALRDFDCHGVLARVCGRRGAAVSRSGVGDFIAARVGRDGGNAAHASALRLAVECTVLDSRADGNRGPVDRFHLDGGGHIGIVGAGDRDGDGADHAPFFAGHGLDGEDQGRPADRGRALAGIVIALGDADRAQGIAYGSEGLAAVQCGQEAGQIVTVDVGPPVPHIHRPRLSGWGGGFCNRHLRVCRYAAAAPIQRIAVRFPAGQRQRGEGDRAVRPNVRAGDGSGQLRRIHGDIIAGDRAGQRDTGDWHLGGAVVGPAGCGNFLNGQLLLRDGKDCPRRRGALIISGSRNGDGGRTGVGVVRVRYGVVRALGQRFAVQCHGNGGRLRLSVVSQPIAGDCDCGIFQGAPCNHKGSAAADSIVAAGNVRDCDRCGADLRITTVGQRVLAGGNHLPAVFDNDIVRGDCLPGVFILAGCNGDCGAVDRLAADGHCFGCCCRLGIVCCRNRGRKGIGSGVLGRGAPCKFHIRERRAGDSQVACSGIADLLAVVGFVRGVAAAERNHRLGLGNAPRHRDSGGGKQVIVLGRPGQGNSAGGNGIRLIHIGAVIGNIRRSRHVFSADNPVQREQQPRGRIHRAVVGLAGRSGKRGGDFLRRDFKALCHRTRTGTRSREGGGGCTGVGVVRVRYGVVLALGQRFAVEGHGDGGRLRLSVVSKVVTGKRDVCVRQIKAPSGGQLCHGGRDMITRAV